ncbi:PTS system, N-acetylglucosamine-specific IIA component PTS system, N-acetylglucosamine-specific IIB component PTS system, N-acetylglucosamine-specific IIC component [Mesoplasma florum W37]|uniref:PTS system N-acetylglucosamine-specific IIA component, PTS system N-acetylglucosamine-specific IIB component, PTS system N-acetylglucosamine-specific IIC component n=1 Tax=Mesoplasma florum TaxID=2151 RepID=A0AAD0HT62_MESFO|nr:PTS transporter subunit EIIC [Mesoplasma florum]AGY41287.1 PTS system, N-acetylglucosamine-specific IIA component PTS system, N-acetylglucosamine-specific IIB component PTS system, N-acetylglucosamine-specific IIC component [Mesoplasma florum W37]AVN59513.1 PTS sugar transporter [Mesoplasma florum]AVN65625.1 PTS system N-acetylglucosamine-specific IIA component, PTS system N-acetylglucosamine-specific IIB component, PTS system N-acetylglucosamine-specific IIC component [Mesoplasma florum]
MKSFSSIEWKSSAKNSWEMFKKGCGNIMPTLSKLSKAFLLPIALLPIAGVFLGVGSAIASNSSADSFGYFFGTLLNKMGDVCFGNLPVLFCISVALAYTKDSGIAAITAVVGFLVMNGMQAALLHTQTLSINESNLWVQTGIENGKPVWEHFTAIKDGKIDWSTSNIHLENIMAWGIGSNADNLQMVNSNFELIDGAGSVYYTLLWINKIPNGLITSNIGINSLNTGVFAGIFVGAIAAKCYNKFHQTQLPSAISFFSGTKLVPIVTFVAVIPLSFIFMFIWPYVGMGLAAFGQASGKLPGGLDSFIYEVAERSLVPFGLHHVFYAPLWWTNAGGSIAEAFNGATEAQQKAFVEVWMKNHAEMAAAWNITELTQFADIQRNISQLYPDLWQSMGDQTMAYKVIANTNVLNFTDLEALGLNIGRFQSGKFGFMLLGLPMAGLAMWLNVPKENRKEVMGIYFSAAFTCFLTGITEPIEYTFLFLAPWLFYGVHMPLAAISFLFAGLFKTHVSMTVSGGFIDYIVFGVIPYFGSKAMSAKSAFAILGVSAAMAPAYFFGFYFAVKYGNVMVPGRDGSTNVQLATKAEYKASKGLNVDGSKIEDGKSTKASAKDAVEEGRIQKATKIIEFLGGEANIVDVDACASRLRLTVKDGSLVDKDGIISLGGATGALIRGTNVQVVYGGEQEAIKPRMIKILDEQRKSKK